jgi:Immunoglobulin-like domain of bacterial spore germination
MTTPPPPVEDRLRRALATEASRTQPTPGSLDTIRTRVGAARRRRRAAAAGLVLTTLVAAAVVLPRLAGRDGGVSTDDNPAATTEPTPAPGPTTPGGGVTTDEDALWPAPGGPRFPDPEDAARSFAGAVLGTADADVSAFRPGETGTGEVDVFTRPGSGRVAGTLDMRRIDGTHWVVAEAVSAAVVLEDPAAGATVSSPVTVTGSGHGYEGTIVVDLRLRSAPDTVVGSEAVIAGSGVDNAPFRAEVTLASSPGGAGILLARTDSGEGGTVTDFAARRVVVRSAGPSSSGTVVSPPTTGTGQPGAFAHQPLWPFASQAEADAWRAVYQAQGSQPWHLDPGQTAISFAHDYLGFTEIDTVTSQEVGATDAWIGVGAAQAPGDAGGPYRVAIVHLARYGAGSDAPWEVVGTRDTDLTLDTPRYGSTVSSPIQVGGVITGVDESLRIQVRQPGSSQPLGETCCQPAGGVDTPWSATVSYSGAGDGPLLIVVSTGGHLLDVERFAITGVRH